jgi:hypothetical protein
MKKNLFIILFVFFGYAKSQAQKRELGNVTIEELKEKVCPKDSSAVAAILFEKGKTFFDYKQNYGFSVVTEVEVKIKVYKKEGYSWANKSVNFYIGGDDDENVSFSKAITYNLVDGKIEKTKLKSEGEFTENINKYWNVKKITMPNVMEGSIIEYSYMIRSPYISNLIDWSFQKSIPINYSEYKTDIPEYYVYSEHFKGSLIPEKKFEGHVKSMTLIYKERDNTPLMYGTARVNNYTESVNYQEKRTTYILLDVPALKAEEFVNNIENYTSTVSNELISIQFPQQYYKNFATNWGDVARKIYENEDFGGQLNKNNYYEDDLTDLLKVLSNEDEKIASIFSFVRSRMNWNKYYSIYCSDGVKKAYQEKTGNTAEINLILISMLRFLGIDANPILVSTRSNGVSLYPSMTAFNTVIAGVKTSDKMILLDATNKNCLPNILPLQDLNWIGRLIKKDGSSEMIDLMPKENSSDFTTLMAVIDKEGNASGQFREQYYDYCALAFRDKKGFLSNESSIETKEKKYIGLEIENYEKINENNLSEPIIEKYNFKSNNSIEIIGDKMYFSPMIYLQMRENLFKQEKREYPIDFNFSTNNKYIVNITIPDGYQVESIPTQCSFSMIDQHANFKYTFSAIDNKIQGVITLNINSSIIPSHYYDTLKEFFRKVIEKENEKIVLMKK